MSTTSAYVGSIVSCLVHSIVEHSNRRNMYEIVVRERIDKDSYLGDCVRFYTGYV